MLFFLYGEDVFRSKEKLRALKNHFTQNNPSAQLSIFDFSEKDSYDCDIFKSLQSQGLFSTRKLIIITNLIKSLPVEKQKTILEKFKEIKTIPTDLDITVIFHEEGVPKKNLSFFKYLFTVAQKQEFIHLNNVGLQKWITNYLKSEFPTVSFSPESLSMLIAYTSNDLYLLQNELTKLATFKITGEITKKDIELLIKEQIRSTVFQMIEALLTKNKKESLQLLHQQLEKGEDPFYLLSMYIYQLRVLLKISSAVNSGNTNPSLIAKETGLHPYVIQKSLPQLKHYSLENLKMMFQEFQKIDTLAKTGKDNIISLLDRLLVKI